MTSFKHTVRVSCDSCGAVAGIPIDDLTVIPNPSGEGARYRFTCPHANCQRRNVKQLWAQKLVELLISSGCRVRVIQDPVIDPPPDPTLPPITWDDLIDFHEQLEASEAQPKEPTP